MGAINRANVRSVLHFIFMSVYLSGKEGELPDKNISARYSWSLFDQYRVSATL